jgi:hypothetical protein
MKEQRLVREAYMCVWNMLHFPIQGKIKKHRLETATNNK